MLHLRTAATMAPVESVPSHSPADGWSRWWWWSEQLIAATTGEVFGLCFYLFIL
jgi:hypothetical protein